MKQFAKHKARLQEIADTAERFFAAYLEETGPDRRDEHEWLMRAGLWAIQHTAPQTVCGVTTALRGIEGGFCSWNVRRFIAALEHWSNVEARWETTRSYLHNIQTYNDYPNEGHTRP